jgi:HPt (histidine-containing phosphotransfer) domain-containing protein
MEYKYINTEYLDSVSGGDNEIILEIIAMFSDQADEIYNEMTNLYTGKDHYKLGLLAHKAKSSVAIMGMEELASLLKTFELQAKDGIATDMYGTYIEKYRNDTLEAIRELDDLAGRIVKK